MGSFCNFYAASERNFPSILIVGPDCEGMSPKRLNELSAAALPFS